MGRPFHQAESGVRGVGGGRHNEAMTRHKPAADLSGLLECFTKEDVCAGISGQIERQF